MTLENTKIQLVKDTIDKKDIKQLINWLKTNPKLTKGELTVEFEKQWSEWLGCKYSVFVNSGSSANLAAVYSLMLSGKLKNKKIVVPAVSWVTTVTPAMQLGLEPIMCDADGNNLGLNIKHLKKIIKEENPAAIILVHVLGFANEMSEIVKLCQENDILLIEDSCEAMGSEYKNKKLGTFGDLSTFSMYFGHHMSTIEGGMVCTNNEELYHILLSIRSHGWDRDLPKEKQSELRTKYNVSDFRALYIFYYPGFNLRATDLQAFIGINQLKKIDKVIKQRNKNYRYYQRHINKKGWKIKPQRHAFVSNFCYPIITPNVDKLAKALTDNDIECRPLICGSIGEHPFWYERYGKQNLPMAKKVHEYGLYIPNHPKLTRGEMDKIIKIVNENI
jgi:CDP-6-deoxy-D-xylo-4-hexulose-3-dehydrase